MSRHDALRSVVVAMAVGAVSPAAYAQTIGTWSSARSPYGASTSDGFAELRDRVHRVFPNATFAPLHSLSAGVLGQIDVLFLDAQSPTPLAADEAAALKAWVEDGGVLVAQAVGATGASMAGPFGVTATRVYDGAEPRVDALPAGAFDGAFGAVRRFANRYDGHLTGPPGAVAVGDEKGSHLVSLDVGRGRAVFFGNLFAFADADLAPGGLLSDPSGDNAALFLNLVGRSVPAPRIGGWSSDRSEVAFATSPAFDTARAAVRATMPGVEFVEMTVLDPAALRNLDVLVLDSTLKEPLTLDEFDALTVFVRGGGAVVAQLYGPIGNAIAGLYGLAVRGTAEPVVRSYTLASTAGVPLSGPFGAAATYQNRYEVHVVGRGTANDGVALAADEGGARLVYVPPTERHGSALLFTNLFAFGDADWSVGGLAGSGNDNITLLGNFLASTSVDLAAEASGAPTLAGPAEELPAWVADYRAAATQAVGGDRGALTSWLTTYRDTAGSAVVLHTAAWLDADHPLPVDPRFFPLDGVVLGTSVRRDLLAAGHTPNEVSKWTFGVGDLVWTCLEGKSDLCTDARVGAAVPAAWAAAGIEADLAPELLASRFESLGYHVTIGVASESPFGRQVVARGFGLLWQADYTPMYQGEAWIGLVARRGG